MAHHSLTPSPIWGRLVSRPRDGLITMTIPCGATVIVRAIALGDTRIPQESVVHGIWSLQVPHEPRPGQACNRKRPKAVMDSSTRRGLAGPSIVGSEEQEGWS